MNNGYEKQIIYISNDALREHIFGFAQVIITGNVADAIEPLMMVNVVEVDEAGRFVEATTTDMNGDFSMRIKIRRISCRFLISVILLKYCLLVTVGFSIS